MSEDFFYDWDIKVREVYREVIAACDPTDGTTKADAKLVAAQRIRAHIDAGDLKVPIDTAINAAIDKADAADSGSADKVMARSMRDEDALDLDNDPGMDVVVALGEGKRKPLRFILLVDLMEMDRLRYRNVSVVNIAYTAWREDYDRALPAVTLFGSFGAAVESGAFKP